jgi:hypothetical protein
VSTTGTTLQERLSEQLMDVFTGAAEHQRAFYAAHSEARPDSADITVVRPSRPEHEA